MSGNWVHDVRSRFWTWNFFFHQCVANLPQNATEIERFLKTFKFWVFFQKIDGFFEKKLENFFKIEKGGKFAVKAYQTEFFRKNVSALIVFWQKIRKFWKLGKLEKKMKFFFREHFSSSYRPSLEKREGPKYAGGSRLSCYNVITNITKLL